MLSPSLPMPRLHSWHNHPLNFRVSWSWSKQGLDKNSAEYANEYARIQAAINAAYGNKEEDDLRIESEYTDIDLYQTDIDQDSIPDIYQGTTSYHNEESDPSKLYPIIKNKKKSEPNKRNFNFNKSNYNNSFNF